MRRIAAILAVLAAGAAGVASTAGADDTHTISNACSASLYALALGTDLLEFEQADTVVVAGVDVITESMFGLLDPASSAVPTRGNRARGAR